MTVLAELGKQYPCRTQGIPVDLDEAEPFAGDVVEFYLESPYVDITPAMAARAIYDILKVKEQYPQSVIHYVKIESRTVTVQYSVAPMGAEATPWVWWQIIAVMAAIVGAIFLVTRLIRGYIWSPPPPVGNAMIHAEDMRTLKGIPNVRISIDGEYRGKTGTGGTLLVEDLLEGLHRFAGEILEGYWPPDGKKQSVIKDKQIDVEIAYHPDDEPEPTEGWLEIYTHPVSGQVWVGTEDMGLAPVKVKLYRGDYSISYGGIEGYITPKPDNATIVGGQTTTLHGYYTLPEEEEEWFEKYIRYALIGGGVILGGALLLPPAIRAITKSVKRRQEE